MTTNQFEKEQARFKRMTLEEKKCYFENLFGIDPSKLSSHIIELFINHKLQSLCYGELSLMDMNRLKCIVQNKEAVKEVRKGRIFKRIYKGKEYVVERLADDTFLYNGKRYRSLSAIATLITGNTRNGFSFFASKRNGMIKG